MAGSFQEQFGGGLEGAVRFASALMGGDDETFKAGYSAENAAISAAEVYGLDRAVVLEALQKRKAAGSSYGDYATESGALDQASGTVYSDAEGGL